MAHSISAKKRMRQNETRRARNRARRAVLKTRLRQSKEQMSRGGDEAATAFKNASRALDVAASQGTIHKNAAGRRKSRMARRLNTAKTKAATA